jgi:3-oxoacyl-[acyl-carrier-protein] synthase-3
MAFLKGFGSYLPERVVTNAEIAARLGCDADWIQEVSGICERRYGDDNESVAEMAVQAANDCLRRTGTDASRLGLIIVASGSSEHRFPGPAAKVANALGASRASAIDLAMASAGSLFGLAIANACAEVYGEVLVIGAEKMSGVLGHAAVAPQLGILFGDGAGACLITRGRQPIRLVACCTHSDGNFTNDLKLEWDGSLQMNGHTVILHAGRRVPQVIQEVLQGSGFSPGSIDVYLVHQANANLITRIARSLRVPDSKFFTNIARYGNTSSASMLLAAAEWSMCHHLCPGSAMVLAAFGAGFHWGSALAVAEEETA